MQKNRQAVASVYNTKDIVTIKQMHGANILHARAEHMHGKEIEADGMITNCSGLILSIQTADCVPVLLASRDGSVAAALHCGWRSSRENIISNVVNQFKETYSISAANLQAIVGPSIMQASYEVDSVFYDSFAEESLNNHFYFREAQQQDRFLFDLPAYVIDKLQQHGIELHTHIKEDTYINAQKYPSYRRSYHKGKQYRGSILSTIAIL